MRGIGPRVQDIQILKMYSQSSSILKDVLMISFQVMHYIMRDFDNFFSPTCKSLYLSRPSETIQATWFLDNVEVWYNLISYFFVPATHQGFKFPSGIILPQLSPHKMKEMVQRQKEQKEKEDEMRRTLGEAKKRLGVAATKVTEVEKMVVEPESLQQDIQQEIARIQERGKERESTRIAHLKKRDNLATDRDVLLKEVDALTGKLEQFKVPQEETPFTTSPSPLSLSHPLPAPSPGPSRQAPADLSQGKCQTELLIYNFAEIVQCSYSPNPVA